MKAVLCEKYGLPKVLQYKDTEKPVPTEGRMIVKVLAASVNAGDWHLMRGKPSLLRPMMGGITKPKDPRFGSDMAGRVESIGANVTKFKPGDEVFGTCQGAFAEYASAREDRVALKPSNASFEEAAAIPVAGITALQGLRDKGHIRRGQKVLINGATGGVGTFAVQIAKAFGELSSLSSQG